MLTTLFGAVFFISALITSPIWFTMIILTSPLIFLTGFLFYYTNLFNPLIKLWFRVLFGLFSRYYQKNDLVFLNTGYAEIES